jgi:hypothetical protein
MAGPIDAVRVFHNAFRKDMAVIDAAALGDARDRPGLAQSIERFRFLNEVLVWHAQGEEVAIFPLLETVAPSVAWTYEQDHRGLDAAYDAFSAAVSARDKLETARASAALKFHLDLHLAKEDAHLYRLIRERVPLPEQGMAVGVMASSVPQARFPEVVAWLFPLVGHVDRETMTRAYKAVMPPEAFARVSQLVRQAIGDDDWVELKRRVPELE